MSLGLALNNALTGLRVNQQAIAVLSQNIANVNTEGYSRQILNQSAITVNGLGSGVRIDDITRKIDKYLQRSVQTQGSVAENLTTISDFYQRIQSILGQPGAGNSIDTFMTRMFNAVQQLAEAPETSSLKGNAIASASALAKQLSDLAAGVQDLRYEADREIGDAIETINGTLDRLKTLNAAITQTHLLGQSTADLLDSRDKALRTLSEFVSNSVSYNDAGAVTVVGGDGIMLLEDGVRHKLHYAKLSSSDAFVQDSPMNALEVLTINDSGQQAGAPAQLLTGGHSEDVKSRLLGGKIEGLHQMRDVKFPAVLKQLDMLASRLRDEVNKIHNSGSGYPPATSLTGDRVVQSTDQYSWQGTVSIAVLTSDGKPVPSFYSDESYTGVRPLTLDLSKLDSGQGNGKPTMQTIIDEINNHFSAPENKAKIGNINNVRLASDIKQLPSGATSLFSFDLDVDNISDTSADVFVTNITVLDDVGTDITNVTQTAPTLTIQSSGSYTTINGSADVTIDLTATPGVAVGDKIYLNPPSAAVNGISVGNLTGFFTVTAVSGSQVTFTAGAAATSTGSVNDVGGIEMYPPYQNILPGTNERTRDSGQMKVDLSSSINSSFYDITLDVSVVGEDGVVHTAPVTYRVRNQQTDIYNKRYSATVVGGAGTLVPPLSSQDSLRALLVDENGHELPSVNGKYIDSPGYLKIVGSNYSTPYSVAIDDLDSKQLGKPDDSPAEPGTNRGFSYYFGLNNFFASNALTKTGDTLYNSAYNLKVQDRLVKNANLISTGTLSKQEKNSTTNNKEVYTYVRYSGDNSVAQKLGRMNSQLVSFDAAGGLPAVDLSLQAYTSEIMGSISQKSSEASAGAENAKTLFNAFSSKSQAISGVNLDEELANTITFQNAYSATARIVTTVNKMYDDLLQTF